jgi:hypothetical protein
MSRKALGAVAVLLVVAGAGFAAGTFLDLRSDGDGTAAPSSGTASGTESETESGTESSESTETGDLGGPTGPCDQSDTSGCAPGAALVVTDSQWRCRDPLGTIARRLGGTLPLKVTAKFTTFVETSGPVVDLREGCTGDGTDAIDLILDIQGDGRTVGGINDALSVKLDAHDIDITGNIDCGPRGPGSHQDGIQAQGARDIAFVDLEVGDWDDKRATCTGASGGIDFSLGGIANVIPTDHACIRCRVIACRRGLNLGVSEGVRVVDSRFRSGNPAEREEELATGEVGLCSFAVSTCSVEPAATGNVFKRNVCDEYPYEGSSRRRR